jgi:hypothetical protein
VAISTGPASPLRPRPGSVPGDADTEGVAGDPEEQGQDQQLPEPLCESDQQGRHGGPYEQPDHDATPAETLGEDAEGQAQQRAVAHGRRSQPVELSGGESELAADRPSEHAEHQPDGEEQRESSGGEDEDSAFRRPGGRNAGQVQAACGGCVRHV